MIEKQQHKLPAHQEERTKTQVYSPLDISIRLSTYIELKEIDTYQVLTIEEQ